MYRVKRRNLYLKYELLRAKYPRNIENLSIAIETKNLLKTLNTQKVAEIPVYYLLPGAALFGLHTLALFSLASSTEVMDLGALNLLGHNFNVIFTVQASRKFFSFLKISRVQDRSFTFVENLEKVV